MISYREPLLGKTDEMILKYISSIKDDTAIVHEVLEVLMAHVQHLMHKNIIPQNIGKKITEILLELYKDPSPLFSMSVEDVHEAIELYIERKIGKDAGWLAIAKSRNDHVVAALRLKVKRLLVKLIDELLKFRALLLQKANQHLETLMPAFTHLQPAQVSTYAHYLTYVEEILATYTKLLLFITKEVIDKSPLGASAATTTTVPIDRYELAYETGFKDLVVNSIVATGSRDFLAIASAISTCLAVFISRIAEDMIIFSTPQFNYLNPDSRHLATSSVMPHKKNLVTMEIARAWGGEAIGHLTALLSILKALPSGYNLDLQEATKHCIRVLQETINTLTIVKDFIEKLEPNTQSMKRDVELYPITSTELIETISLRLCKPYREVHRKLALVIRSSKSFKDALDKVFSELGVYFLELKPPIEPKNSIYAKNHPGSPHPLSVKNYITKAEKRIRDEYIELDVMKKNSKNPILCQKNESVI
ncbi:MAG: argininosuccinate lyase [Thermoprotei archaeon]|mgnify:CR=1 FL=1|nr:MAG: argininosuccinate lyase [Thermoprotei archaeon]